jgi:tripartite-type tricarboxylate transporter receptor subunit TctC
MTTSTSNKITGYNKDQQLQFVHSLWTELATIAVYLSSDIISFQPTIERAHRKGDSISYGTGGNSRSSKLNLQLQYLNLLRGNTSHPREINRESG